MRSARSGTAAARAKMGRWPRATFAPSNCARATASSRLRFQPFPPVFIAFPQIAPPGSRFRRRWIRWSRRPWSAVSSSAAFRRIAPPCMRSRWPNSAALVPIDPAATLPQRVIPGGDMISRHGLRPLFCGALLIVAAASSAAAEGTFDIPPGAHFNPQRLEKIGEFFRNEVATGKIPGAILLIQQHGKPVYHESFGVQDVVSKAPITDKTIFRLFSMTKPITTVAAMTLIDAGKIKIDDPLAIYIPSFATAKVGVEKKADNGEMVLALEPLKRPLTILDLMTQTSGITYGFYGDNMVRKAYANAKIYDGDFNNAEFAERIAHLPLAEQPGTLWDYGHSTDILGRVIEVASGKSLLQYEKQSLLDPLGLTDTTFYVTDPAKQKLIALPMPNTRASQA